MHIRIYVALLIATKVAKNKPQLLMMPFYKISTFLPCLKNTAFGVLFMHLVNYACLSLENHLTDCRVETCLDNEINDFTLHPHGQERFYSQYK